MRTKKALYNIIGQMSYEIVTMVCGLILPRFILAAFGSNYNGMVLSITQFLDYISFLTLGVAGATRVAIYKSNAEGDLRKTSAILKATERYMHKVGYAFIVYIALMIFIYPNIVRDDFEWFESASLVFIIGISVFAEYFFGITYKTFLAANQSTYVYNIVQIVAKIANTIVSVILISCGQSIQIVKLASAACFAISPITLSYIVRRKYKLIMDVEPDDSALKNRRDVMAHSIANCVHQYTDVFLLTLFTSPAVISVYSVYTLVLGTLRKLQIVFTTGLEAAFGELWAKNEKARFEKNLNTFEYLIFAFVSIVFSCAIFLLLPFVALYTKNVTDIEYILPLFGMLSISAYAVLCIRTPYLVAVQAAGRYRETRNGAIMEAALNLGLSLIAVFKFGLIGVTIGTLAANLFRTLQYVVYISKHMLHRSIWKFIKRCGWLCISMAAIIVLKMILPAFEIASWFGWVVNGMYCFAIAGAVTVITSLIFCRKDFFEAIRLTKRMLMKKRSKQQ